MLVLSRKVGQKLVINENVTVVITRIAGNRVQLGIEAPQDVHIMRGELDKIRSEFSASDESSVSSPLAFTLADELDPATHFSSRPVH